MSQRSLSNMPNRQVAATTAPAHRGEPAIDAQDLIDNLPIGVFVFRVDAPGVYYCRMANRFLEELFEFERHRSLGLAVTEFHTLRQGEPFKSQFDVCLDCGQPVTFEWQLSRPPEQQFYACQVTPLTDETGEIVELLGTITDRTSERRAERQMLHNALHDHLTGLPNRVLFQDRLERALKAIGGREASQCAVLILNVDRFQAINESLGHIAGDEFLIAFAARLKNCLRGGERLARFNGDEFAILIDHMTDLSEAMEVADSVHEILREPFVMGGETLYVTASIGLASTLTSPPRSEDLIRDADFALHRAKSAGRARTETYLYRAHQEAQSLFQLEAELRSALKSGALELHYQPIMDLDSGALVGFEALARWPHPSRGMISPLEFIPLAEETGLIVPLGRWALEKACHQLRDWQEQLGALTEGLAVGVNVSGVQFARDDIVAAVAETLAQTGLQGHDLKLELTETALMENPDLATDVLHQLKRLDVALALDDFGTGYSSLSYLQRFPFDMLKIDRGFIKDIDRGGENYQLVEIMVMLAQRLKLAVIAEGIETEEQSTLLTRLGCHFGQGYFFEKPLDRESATAFIQMKAAQAHNAA